LIILRNKQTHKINLNSKENNNKIIKHISPCSLSHCNENWTIKAWDARRITAAKLHYTRKSTGYNWEDYETNTEIAKELNITPVLEKKWRTAEEVGQCMSTEGLVKIYPGQYKTTHQRWMEPTKNIKRFLGRWDRNG